MTDLIIVESPGKVKTVGQYAGPGYRVRASVGHVRDLPDDDLGIDVDNGFGETYAVTKPDVVAGLKKAAKGPGVRMRVDQVVSMKGPSSRPVRDAVLWSCAALLVSIAR